MKHEISGGYMELTVRVIIADDHPTVLLGIKHALVAGKTIDVVGMAKNSHELIRMLAVEECDVLVTDYSMPGGDYGDGLPLLGLIQRSHPHLHIVVMTMMDNPALLKTLLKNGVRCLVHKSDDVMHLIPAVHAAHAGGQYLSPAITAMQHLFNRDCPLDPGLLSCTSPVCPGYARIS
ncbi:response regulator transcription factor, partial [Herbaspirillum sp. RTI4]